MIKGWIKTRIALAAIGLVFALCGTIVAPFLPMLVERTIDGRVRDSVRLNPATMSDSSLQQFLNSSANVDYHLYNITNLYQALTVPNTPLRFSDVPVRTLRYVQKYNVEWDADADRVTYDEIATLQVHPDDQELLERPIIGINPFYVGVAAQVMRQVMQQQQQTTTPSADFTLLSEQLLTAGLLGGQILPAIAQTFTNGSLPFLARVRLLAVPLYLEMAQATSEAAGEWLADRDAWANGIARLSLRNASQFAGFELPRSLACSNPIAAAAALFDTNNTVSLVSASGANTWLSVVVASASNNNNTVALLVSGNQLTSDDVFLVAGWLAGLASTPAYEATACNALDQVLRRAVASSTVLEAAVADAGLASFLPPLATWAQVGALQWATGWVLAALLSPGGAWMASGVGLSENLLELQAGIDFYVASNPSASAAGSNQVFLWQTNPRLLLGPTQVLVPGAAWPVVLSTITATRLLSVLASNSAAYGALCQILGGVAGAYATVLQLELGAGQNLTAAVQQATAAANSAIATLSAANAALLLAAAGVDETNWYRVFCYLYNYLGMSLTGTLQQLDPQTGVAPQNNGLFASRTVSQMLFGYENNVGGVTIPPLTFGYPRPSDDAGMAVLLVRDGRQYAFGRRCERVMGLQDVNNVGQWSMYDGVASFSTNCDLVDPARTYTCATSAGRASLDWTIYVAPGETIAGSNDALHSPPLREGDSNILHQLVFYVPELQRRVPVAYEGPVTTQDIDLRRYRFDPIMSVGGTQDNPWKNNVQWKQGGVPDGLISLQALDGGLPAFASQPYFGRAPTSVFSGIECTRNGSSISCGDFDVDSHDTFLDVEPLTGLTMCGAKRLQANVRISASEYRTSATTNGWNYHYNNLFNNNNQTIYVPYYWVDQQDSISDTDAQTFRATFQKVLYARRIARQLRIAGLVIGCFGIVASLLLLMHAVRDYRRATYKHRVASLGCA